MPGLNFIGIFLATSLHTVLQTNVTKERSLLILYLNKHEFATSTTPRSTEEYDFYVETEINIVWHRFISSKLMAIQNKVEIRKTTPMQKEIAVTESSTIGSQSVSLDDTEDKSTSDKDINTDITESDADYNSTEPLEQLPDFIFDDNIIINISDTRRQRQWTGPVTRKQKPFRYINARSPYWQNGHQIFEGNINRRPTTNETVTNEPWRNIMNDFNDCNPTCIYYFIAYGKVCGHRYNTKLWENQYKNFKNICEMDIENCKEEDENWHPLYRGECQELRDFTKLPMDWFSISDRKDKLWDNYSYIPPTATDASADAFENELAQIILSQTKAGKR